MTVEKGIVALGSCSVSCWPISGQGLWQAPGRPALVSGQCVFTQHVGEQSCPAYSIHSVSRVSAEPRAPSGSLTPPHAATAPFLPLILLPALSSLLLPSFPFLLSPSSLASPSPLFAAGPGFMVCLPLSFSQPAANGCIHQGPPLPCSVLKDFLRTQGHLDFRPDSLSSLIMGSFFLDPSLCSRGYTLTPQGLSGPSCASSRERLRLELLPCVARRGIC